MRVQAADLSYKKSNQVKQVTEGNASGVQGPNGPSADKAKIIKKTQKLAAKLADWGDEPSIFDTASRHQKPVKTRFICLENMFTLKELDEDKEAILDITEDIREELEKYGVVHNVKLIIPDKDDEDYEKKDKGLVQVNFADADSAERAINALRGRTFAGKAVEAYYVPGKKLRKSKVAGDHDKGDNSD